ncbi:hypothetical protein BDR04DRAFT_1094169 [Suillus decipiens]|nr:hypothetical protein BDR04DRAFT_1094169 [Suillus decipiens]
MGFVCDPGVGFLCLSSVMIIALVLLENVFLHAKSPTVVGIGRRRSGLSCQTIAMRRALNLKA